MTRRTWVQGGCILGVWFLVDLCGVLELEIKEPCRAYIK